MLSFSQILNIYTKCITYKLQHSENESDFKINLLYIF